ncbi:MAG TPA: TolC family protein [Bryobacteraceae bacterium]|jgi:cobalt-zinc-cadmium efflux system outer membrane protein|nr:TolC family protein [Bryobacteraceae bacterium]
MGLLLVTGCMAQSANQPRTLTWQQTQQEFRTNNPQLLAGQVTIDESRADEITAYLRPNPDFTLSTDGTQITKHDGIWRPFSGTFVSPDISYLHERQHKRELRLASAQKATAIAISAQSDLERNLTFNLRDAFVRVLLAKAVSRVAKENLGYYDKEIAINRERYKAGGIAKVDFQRVELQRVQYQSDLATAEVDLRTAKIDLIALLREKTPVDQFDVSGDFDFNEPVTTIQDLRTLALETRPDLKQAGQSLEKARTDHQLSIANGSTDPTFSLWYTHNGSFNNPGAYNTLGASVSIPLRIFDRNQGDKLHTLLDIGRNQKLLDEAQITALHDVDSAFVTLQSTLQLLRPYKDLYLGEASQVRETVSFAYQHGAASLLDFLDAQKEYRDTELNYVNLVGAYLSAANQLNFAVGREVIR